MDTPDLRARDVYTRAFEQARREAFARVEEYDKALSASLSPAWNREVEALSSAGYGSSTPRLCMAHVNEYMTALGLWLSALAIRDSAHVAGGKQARRLRKRAIALARAIRHPR